MKSTGLIENTELTFETNPIALIKIRFGSKTGSYFLHINK